MEEAVLKEPAMVSEKKGLSGSTIKLIAIVTMFIDHMGAGLVGRIMSSKGMVEVIQSGDLTALTASEMKLYWLYVAMRMIGRVAFPIFCFLLVEGFQKTSNRNKYALRLGIFALVAEVPFDLCFYASPLEFTHQNVFFTLFIALLTMMGCNKVETQVKSKIGIVLLDIVVIVLGMIVAELLKTDYAAIGVFCILMIYLTRKNKVGQLIAGCAVFLWEVTAPIAFVFVGFYNGKRGLSLKYFFYLFYPLHLLLIYGISMYLGIAQIPGC